MLVREACMAARSHLAALGEVGEPLVQVVDAVRDLAASREASVLSEASFGVEVRGLLAATDAAVVVRALDLLRSVASTVSLVASAACQVTVREAVAEFRTDELFTSKAEGTRNSYARWCRRLDDRMGDRVVSSVRTADLAAFVASEVVESPWLRVGHVNAGKSATIAGITTMRLLWRFCDENGYADRKVADRLNRPDYEPVNGEAWTWMHQASVRHFVLSSEQDPVAMTMFLWLAQFAFMRGAETCRLRNCDLLLSDEPGRDMVRFWGKGSRWRDEPVIEPLGQFVRWFMEDRRPAHVDPDEWARMEVPFVRTRPDERHPMGRPYGKGGYSALRARVKKEMPHVLDGRRRMHGIGRSTGGARIGQLFGESVAQVALGHRSLRSGGVALPSSTPVYTGSHTRRDSYAAVREALLDYWLWANTPPPLMAGPQGTPLMQPMDPTPPRPLVVDGVLDVASLVPPLTRVGWDAAA